MKYIIWGAGQRGKKALKILGKEKVVAFVDQNYDIQGDVVDGIIVYGPDYIDINKNRYIILITPVNYEKKIAQLLEKKQIYTYLFFSECPYCINMDENVDSMSNINNLPELYGKIAIFDITWFTLYLYDYLKNKGKDVFIYAKNKDVFLKILNCEYKIFKDIKFLNNVNYVISSHKIECIPKEKYIDIENLIEKTYQVSNYEIVNYKNIHKGKRCFIVATGPSLKISDLDKLQTNGDICISMNRIYNIFNKTSWRPDYYVIEDQKMIEDLSGEIIKLDLKHKFVSDSYPDFWKLKNINNCIKYKMIMQNCLTDRIGFSLNPERLIYNGYTVTYVCLQLAVYMGFSNIYLMGVDFNYSEDIYSEKNHFEGYQNYYKDIRLNPIMPDRMKRAYKKAKNVSESLGIHIYNATRGGKLEVFDRVDLDDII